jgi:hypothetical protein
MVPFQAHVVPGTPEHGQVKSINVLLEGKEPLLFCPSNRFMVPKAVQDCSLYVKKVSHLIADAAIHGYPCRLSFRPLLPRDRRRD